jgi:5-methylcytosine-specific restriction enzyme A
VRRLHNGDAVEENWRFHNWKDVTPGDRVFLLLQGKRGPAIIGYGRVSRKPEKAENWVGIKFDGLLDPTTHVLASKNELTAVDGFQRLSRTQSSGILLPDDIAATLEGLVVGRPAQSLTQERNSNPDWTRDELIVALNFYLQHRPNPPSKDSKEISDLSRTLNRLGEKLFPPDARGQTFRNANGVYMKLMNFRRLDPQYTGKGKTGLARGAKLEEEVWAEFADDPARCHEVAEAIIATLGDPQVEGAWFEPEIEGLQEAEEGRLLTRQHVVRERDRRLVDAKIKQVMKRTGKLACEVCKFDFASFYGKRGKGFIECHHIKPVATLATGHKTHINDLALVCANCHRMIHRNRPWLSVAELKAQMVRGKSATQ